MFLFISGAEIVFIFFVVLLIFGADKIPSIARTLAKGVNQVRNATNEIKNIYGKTSCKKLVAAKYFSGSLLKPGANISMKKLGNIKTKLTNRTNETKRIVKI